MRWHSSILGCAGYGVVVLASIGPRQALAEESVGDRFRKVIERIDAQCKQQKRGPYLDRSDPEFRDKVADTSCDVLLIQPRDWRSEDMATTSGQPYPIPSRWLKTPGAQFVHSIRLPAPYDNPPQLYRSGIGGEEYFLRLCREDAGEFILESAQDVSGIRVDRPKTVLPRGYRDLVFHTVEWSFLSTMSPEDLVAEDAYQFVEIRRPSSETQSRSNEFLRLTKSGESRVPLDVETTEIPKAKYVATWRGIRRPHDWEHGIYGQEIIVLHASSAKVMAIKRSFTRYEPFGGSDPRDVFPRPCPSDIGQLLGAGQGFIRRSLVPSRR